MRSNSLMSRANAIVVMLVSAALLVQHAGAFSASRSMTRQITTLSKPTLQFEHKGLMMSDNARKWSFPFFNKNTQSSTRLDASAAASASSDDVNKDSSPKPAELKNIVKGFDWPTPKTLKKLLPLGMMLFFILFNYTILRDTKDVLVSI